jgi:hypothetical protein
MRFTEPDPIPLGNILAVDALAELEGWLATLDYPPEWQWVLRIDGPLPYPLPIELAKATLDAHISACMQSFSANAIAWNHKILMERFLSVSVAFDVVTRRAADDARMKLLATLPLSQPPFFDGLDLWLQRRALFACVACSGVQFIKDHWNDLRVEAILSLVIGDLLTRRELLELRASLQGRSLDSLNLGVAELLGALEMKVDRLAREPAHSPLGSI